MDILNKSNEIVNMIKNASSVFLMAHKDLDLDALNSCIGMNFFLKNLKKKSYIIIDDMHYELAVKKVLDVEKEKISIIKSNKINSLLDEKSLLLILDTSKIKLTQNPEIVSNFNSIINIDHHSRAKDSMDCKLQIIDENSSSACEMITMFLKENKMIIPSRLATLLLSGIVLDTGSYKLNTSANTFAISSYLMECGAEMASINELLKQDIRDYVKRQKIISSVKVINDVAIGRGLQRSEYKKEEIAKTADSLLTFNRIKASFVVAKISKTAIGISARSAGEVNVGKVLEYFDGGGNECEAAAMIEGATINKVLIDLFKIIKNL